MLRRARYHIAVFLSVIGPGFITAVVDNDAGGIFNPPASYTLAAAVQSTAGQDASAATIVRHGLPASSENPGAIDLGTTSAAWAATDCSRPRR